MVQKENNWKIAIVASMWYDDIIRKLIDGAKEYLLESNVKFDEINLYRCPGAMEIPLTVESVIKTKTFDAVIALGLVVRGETAHFEYVSSSAIGGIASLSLSHSIPVANGILTTNTIEQAQKRAGVKNNNKGYESALVAVKMLNLLEQIKKGSMK